MGIKQIFNIISWPDSGGSGGGGGGTASDNLVLFFNDGEVATTSNFNTDSGSGGPNYTKQSITNLTGTPIDATIDPTSNGDAGWILASDGLYRVTGIQSTPTATLQYSFGANVMVTGGIDAAKDGDAGNFVAAGARIASGSADWHWYHTVDGGANWVDHLDDRADASIAVPAMDPNQAGRFYIGLSRSVYHCVAEITNYGANVYKPSTVRGTNGTGSSMHVPVQDSFRYVYCGSKEGSNEETLMRADMIDETIMRFDLINDDDSPATPGPANAFGIKNHMIGSPSSNGNRLFVVTRSGGGNTGFFYTSGALNPTRPSFTQVFYALSGGGDWRIDLRGVNPVDDNEDLCVLFGANGAVALYDVNSGVDDRSGDLVTAATAIAGFQI